MRISDWSSDVCSSDLLTHVEHNLAVEGAESLSAEHLAALVKMETSGELTATQAKAVLAEMVDTGEAPAAIAEAKGYEAMSSDALERSEEHTSELQSLMRSAYAVFCLQKKKQKIDSRHSAS